MIKLNSLTIGGTDCTKYATAPLQTQDTLDESLDALYLELKHTSRETPFKPFEDVVLEITDGVNTKTLGMLVESDQVTEEVSLKRYNHDLLLAEKTKWLERLFVEKTIRQPLVHDYLEGAVFAVPEELIISAGVGTIPVVSNYMTPMRVGTQLHFPPPHDVWVNPHQLFYSSDSLTVYKYAPDDPQAITSGDYEGYVRLYSETEGGFLPQIDGYTTTLEETTYIALYDYRGDINSATDAEFQYSITAITEAPPRADYTIQDTCEQLLQNVECLTARETPLFELAMPSDYNRSQEYKDQIQRILNSKSPEFTFSKMSLFEAFKLIGDWGHFIPRLIGKKIYFDLLGQTELEVSNLERYISSTANQSSNEFCTKLDSQFSNLTNIDDEEEGSVVTPNNKEYRTVRTEESSVQITDDNTMHFITEYPIEKVLKLEIGKVDINGTVYEVGDITPYVYEASEYSTLDSFSKYYPQAKMYALKYTKGEQNITELNFKRQNVVSQAFESVAIKNIVFRKLGMSAGAWASLVGNLNPLDIHYRLTYIPSTDARVTQSKVKTEDIDKELSIAYNQSAGKLSSDAFGENLKGVIAKYGNVEKTKTYILPTIDLIPEVGKLFDEDYYIATVKCEYYPTFIKCELGLSKDFNNKSAYVETNSRLQFFEYDRDVVIDRYILREDYCIIGDDVTTSPGDVFITTNGVEQLADWLKAETRVYDEVSFAKVSTYDENDEPIMTDSNGNNQPASASTITLGLGNSILCSFKLDDSVSAGQRAYYDGVTKYQEYVKYVDDYGEVYAMNVKLMTKTAEQSTYSEEVDTGDNLPIANNLNEYSWCDKTFVIQKGVGEIPHFSYQMHFVTNTDLIIGSGMAHNFPLVKRIGTSKPQFYVLPKRLNKFETAVDTTGLTGVDLVTSHRYSYKIGINNKTAQADGKAWAVVQDGELLFGRNIEIKTGDTVELPTINFTHKIKGV